MRKRDWEPKQNLLERFQTHLIQQNDKQTGLSQAQEGVAQIIRALESTNGIAGRIKGDPTDRYGFTIPYYIWSIQFNSNQIRIKTASVETENESSSLIISREKNKKGKKFYTYTFVSEGDEGYVAPIRRGRLLRQAREINQMVGHMLDLPSECFYPPQDQLYAAVWMTPYDRPKQPQRVIDNSYPQAAATYKAPTPLWEQATDALPKGVVPLQSIEQNPINPDHLAAIQASPAFLESTDEPTRPRSAVKVELNGLIAETTLPKWLREGSEQRISPADLLYRAANEVLHRWAHRADDIEMTSPPAIDEQENLVSDDNPLSSSGRRYRTLTDAMQLR